MPSGETGPCSKIWEKPHACFSRESPRSALVNLQGPAWRWADSQERARAHVHPGTGRGHVGLRGFQAASGQGPCVLTTVTSPAHSETQHKAPPGQRSRLTNMLHHRYKVSFQTRSGGRAANGQGTPPASRQHEEEFFHLADGHPREAVSSATGTFTPLPPRLSPHPPIPQNQSQVRLLRMPPLTCLPHPDSDSDAPSSCRSITVPFSLLLPPHKHELLWALARSRFSARHPSSLPRFPRSFPSAALNSDRPGLHHSCEQVTQPS